MDRRQRLKSMRLARGQVAVIDCLAPARIVLGRSGRSLTFEARYAPWIRRMRRSDLDTLK